MSKMTAEERDIQKRAREWAHAMSDCGTMAERIGVALEAIQEAVTAAVLREREACVGIVEAAINSVADPSWQTLHDIRLAIRARGEQNDEG